MRGMVWSRGDERVRIAADSRRAGLLTLVVGGLVLAGALVVLVPRDVSYGDSHRLYCGTPLSAAFKKGSDYAHEYVEQAKAAARNARSGSRRYTDILPVVPSGLRSAGDVCGSSGRTRIAVGGGLIALGIVALLAVVLAGRRRPAD